jgi:glutaconate CoA-transferase subunit A
MKAANGRDKVMGLGDAIRSFVKSGSHVSIGGFTISRNPMAAVYEIIRQEIGDLHVYAHSNGQGVDELVGAGCVRRLEIAYGGNGRFAPTCIRFARAVREGTVLVEDYSNYHMTLRFLAGAMGVPFLPTLSSLGTDIVRKWGFSEEMRRGDPKIPGKKLVVAENPFGEWGGASRVLLLPAVNPDVTIIHVQAADTEGTCRIRGLAFADVEQAKAAGRVIVTCEELLEPGQLRREPDRNQVPALCVDAVVQVPFGAYPTACHLHYDYDPAYLRHYADCAADDRLFKQYLDTFVYGVEDHAALLGLVGRERLERIKADPGAGYRVGLDRR